MNYTRVALAGLAGGVVMNIADFVMHGFIMADTYTRLSDVFSQEPANPLWFLLVSVCLGLAAALIFAKTRASWGAGLMGGVTFGALLGLFAFFSPFYNPLVFDGFPYYLAWCWGGMNFIDAVLLGATLGLIYKR